MTISGEVYTHAGKFHADDVFASAFLRIFGFEGKINRVSNVPAKAYASNSLVYDIGGGEFDHHQEEKQYRYNGVAYAAFGLIVEASGINEIFPEFDEYFVAPLDNADNGGDKTEISRIIADMNPSFYNTSPEAYDEAFEEAVYLAETILSNKIRKLFDEIIATEMVDDLIKEGKCIETVEGDIVLISLDCFIPLTYYSCYGHDNIAGIICPSDRDLGHYNIVCRKTHKISNVLYEHREEISGITFVHSGKFIAVCNNIDTAIKIAQTNIVSWDTYWANNSADETSLQIFNEVEENNEEDYSRLIRHPNRRVS